jgi:RNA polymerase sigma factor (sigma-70 family)
LAVTEDDVVALYRAHIQPARAFAVALTGDPALAEDVVHDAFIRCAARRSALRDPAAFGGYLLRAVFNAVASHHRSRAAEGRLLRRIAGQAAGGPPAQPGMDVGEREELLAALQALPLRQRTAVAARYLLDWSEAQTAQAMDCRVGTVKALTSRGLDRLRESYGVREGSEHD